MVATCTWVEPSPRPPPVHKPGPPAWPRLNLHVTSAFMMLYLTQSWCFSFRFQLTLASMLLRFRRWLPELKKLAVSPERFGAGTRASSFIMGPFKRAAGMTLSAPFVEKTERPVPSRLPVKRSKIIPCCRGTEPPSVVGIIMGLPFLSLICAPSLLVKSPLLKSAGGTEKSEEKPTRSKVPSQSAKKNSLFFRMGPPMLPPSMFRMILGFLACLARFSSHRKARKALLSWKPKRLPWYWLVPDFVTTVMAAPPVMPCSASKLLVETLTVSMLSTGATYTAW